MEWAWGVVAGLIDIGSFIPYVGSVLRPGSRVRPSRISWPLWAGENAALLAASLAGGGRNPVWITAGETAGCLVLSVLAWTRPRSRADDMPLWLVLILLAGTGIALGAWAVVTPAAAIVLLVLVDVVAAVVTIRKTWLDPRSESMPSWLMFAGASLVDLFAVGHEATVLFVYPATGLVIGVSVVVSSVAGPGSGRRHVPVHREWPAGVSAALAAAGIATLLALGARAFLGQHQPPRPSSALRPGHSLSLAPGRHPLAPHSSPPAHARHRHLHRPSGPGMMAVPSEVYYTTPAAAAAPAVDPPTTGPVVMLQTPPVSHSSYSPDPPSPVPVSSTPLPAPDPPPTTVTPASTTTATASY
jgi:hypothetical protein